MGMRNGFVRFCGIRFGVTSPKDCSLHHFTGYDANRFFQKAKKNLEYELALIYPHLQPGWSMELQKLGNIQKSVTLRIGKYMDDSYYLRAVETSSSAKDDSVQFVEVAKTPKMELLLAGVEVKDNEGEEDLKLENVKFRKPEQIRNLAELEKADDDVFNNQHSYLSYNQYYANIVKTQ